MKDKYVFDFLSKFEYCFSYEAKDILTLFYLSKGFIIPGRILYNRSRHEFSRNDLDFKAYHVADLGIMTNWNSCLNKKSDSIYNLANYFIQGD